MGPFCVTWPNPTHGSTQPMDNSEIYYHHGFAEPSALLGCDANLMLGGSVSSCATYKVKTSKFTVGRGIYSSVTLYVPCAARPVLMHSSFATDATTSCCSYIPRLRWIVSTKDSIVCCMTFACLSIGSYHLYTADGLQETLKFVFPPV